MQAIFEFIEVFYNRKRAHSSLKYKSPEEYETSLEPMKVTIKKNHSFGLTRIQEQGEISNPIKGWNQDGVKE